MQCYCWFQRCDQLLSGWTEAQKISSTTTALISSVSCPVVDTLIGFPLLICSVTPGAVPAHIHSAGLQTSTKRSRCAPLLLCICQYNGNLYCFFLGNKYKNVFPISAAWQSHKLTRITVCVSSSSTSSHCGQKLLRTYALTGRDTTELYRL